MVVLDGWRGFLGRVESVISDPVGLLASMAAARSVVCLQTYSRPGGVEILLATKMEMPLWLAKGLYEKKRRVLSVELPKVYRQGWRTVFGADPTVVDLHKMGPYYYGLGSQILHFDSPENQEIAQTVLQTFIGRFRRTMDSSQNAYNEDTSVLVERLDCLERSLFKAGQSGLNGFQLWEKGRSSHLTASSLVINYRKRKIADLQA
ncbi:DNA replication complex GINS protein PSF3-like isoform X2 [Myxocyprinus asiaticus]|uniref:DNA replication complex GINS protein PSF3-like isoform X2 n=1 Tax=Myxocyprinus asiaticus TaxID=70543 RepID=UPI0022228B3A|nr:DNA replication complex GINS protein PSF3-like isoform X2 [Myxocyprinus asiaticus]